jgi:hypothetical protein
MVKGLSTRFNNAFEVGNEWEVERWQQLFLSHPILSLLGQGFVWAVTHDSKTQLFRPDLGRFSRRSDELRSRFCELNAPSLSY